LNPLVLNWELSYFEIQKVSALQKMREKMLLQKTGKVYLRLEDGREIEITERSLEEIARLERFQTDLAEFKKEILPDYSLIRSPINVRELFVRIFDRLGFEILLSQDGFPNYVLLRNKKELSAHVVVNAREFQGLPQQPDLLICWKNDRLRDETIEILELSRFYDLLDILKYLHE